MEDIYCTDAEIQHFDPDLHCVVDSGITIDVAKTVNVLSCIGKRTNDSKEYFWVVRVTGLLKELECDFGL
jgi:hypothetical protein